MKKRLAGAVLAVACLAAAQADANNVSLIYSNGFNKTDTQTGVVADEWIRRVEQATQGRVKTRHVAGGALLKPEGTLEGIRKGVADMGAVTVSYHIGELPISAALAGALDVEYGNKLDLMGVTAVTQRLYEEIPEFQEEYAKLGVKGLLWVPAGQYTIIGRAEIKTLDDFKGKKIRAFGSSLPKFFDALGAAPVAIAFGELYTSLQTGVIDSLITNPTAVVPARLHEVSKFALTTGPKLGTSLAGPTVNYVISLNSWNKIAEADRKAIEQVSREMLRVGAQTMTEGTSETYKKLEAAGIKIHHLSEADTARMGQIVPDFFKLAAEDLEKRGLPGGKIFARYRELADDYASGKWKPSY